MDTRNRAQLEGDGRSYQALGAGPFCGAQTPGPDL